MRKFIKTFSTYSEYSEFTGTTDFRLPNVSYCKDDINTIRYNSDTRFIAKFNVTNISSPTKIANDITEFKSIEIDGVIQPLTTGFTFDTLGQHLVKYWLTNSTRISSSAFSGCTDIVSVRIPDTITTIGNYAFSGCNNINIYMENEETPPSLGTSSFSNDSIIYVPTCSLIDTYRSASGWGTYASRITALDCPLIEAKFNVTSTSSSVKILNNVSDFETIYIDDVEETVTSTYRFSTTGTHTIKYKPSNLSSISNRSFYQCTAMTNTVIPYYILSIGDYAFSGCNSLKEVIVESDTPPTLGTNAFNNVSSYCLISISNCGAVDAYKSASGWSSYASKIVSFNCPYVEAKINVANTSSAVRIVGTSSSFTFIEVDGVKMTSRTGYTFSTVGEHTVRYNLGNSDSIGASAFTSCSAMTNIEIPNDVTSIGERAFYQCSAMASVVIPDSVESIGAYAFYYCRGLTSISIPSGVTSIENNTFQSCFNLANINIPSGVTSIGNYAFNGCYPITSITIPDSVTSIGNNAFSYCDLTYIEIPDSVTSIGNNAFEYCSGLTSVSIGSGLTSISNYAFSYCSGLTMIDIPDNITNIGDYAFNNCRGLTNVIIPDSVTSIGYEAFYRCSAMTNCTIGSGVTSIGQYAFSNCSGLTSVTIEATTPPTLGSSAFSNIGSNCFIYVPTCSLVSTYRSASGWSTYSTRIIAPDCQLDVTAKFNVTSTSSVVRIASAMTNFSFMEIDGVKMTNRTGYTFSTTGEHTVKYSLIDSTIGTSAFTYCSSMKSVEISSGVTNINSYAFYYCSNLTRIFVNSETPPTLASYVFSSSSFFIYVPTCSLVSLYKSASGWSNYASNITASDCPTDLTAKFNVTSTSSAVKIANSATSFNFVEIDGVRMTSRTGYTFSTTGEHTVVYSLVDSTAISTSAFTNCSAMTSIELSDDITSIGNNAFYNCSGLTSVNIPSGVTSIGEYVFYYNRALSSITIPSGVTIIGQYAFKNCDKLTSIVIPDSVTSIGNQAFYYCTGLTSCTIGSGVTSIGNSAFSECKSLTSCTIGSSVTSIGQYAFQNCSGLTDIVIPDSVTSIENYAFYNCMGLTTCTIGNGVTSIGQYAFYYNSALDSITIPSGVTSIGYSAFYGCSRLTSINVEAETPTATLGSNAFSYTNDCPILVPTCSAISAYKSTSGWSTYSNRILASDCPTDLTAKFNVTSTSSPTRIASATTGFSLIEVDGVKIAPRTGYTFSTTGEHTVKYGLLNQTTISTSAFTNCALMTDIEIPSGVTTIGTYAFRNCDSLSGITIDPNNSVYDSRDNCNAIIESSSNSLIIGCKNTIIPNTVTSIGENAFFNCSGLTSISIPDSVTTIGYAAFALCSGLTTCTIGSGVTSIGNNAFESCTGLTSINIPDSVTSIGSNAFYNCRGLTTCTIGSGVTSIGNYAFQYCYALTSTTIPSGVTSIGTYAFYYCSGLTTADIQGGSVGDYAFASCSGMTSCTIGSGVTSIGGSSFNNCNRMTTCTIGSGVTSIGSSAFANCSKLTDIDIPSSVTSIGQYAFDNCYSVSAITVDSNNSVYDSRNNCNAIIETSTNKLIFGCKNTVIPNTVITIADRAFYQCSGLTSIVIPDSVTSIGNYTFYSCKGLTSCTVGSGVTTIGTNSFQNSSGLIDIVIPDSVTNIGNYAFGSCSGLTSCTIGSGVTTVGQYAFSYCSGLTIADIQAGSIGDYAFYYCSGMTSVTFGSGVTSIGSSAFWICSGLTSIVIPDSVTSIGNSAFYNCSSLTSIIMEATTPPTITTPFNGTSNCPIYVPTCSLVDVYKAASGWSDYASRITALDCT